MQAIAHIPRFGEAAGWVNSVLLPERFGGKHLAPSAADLFRKSPETRRSPETHPFSVLCIPETEFHFLKTSFVLDL